MQFGVCGDPSRADIAARASYDYAEWSVSGLLKPLDSEEAFREALAQARAVGIPFPVVNGFIPTRMKITGPEVDPSSLESYVGTAMIRAEEAGVEVVVFGSGGARRIPDGFDADRAHEQLVRFAGMAGRIAAEHGVTVVVEPLNLAECNVLNTVAECADLVNEVDHPGLRLLVDAYHLLKDNDRCEDVAANGPLLRHVHIATVPNRRAPGAEECDFIPFFQALATAGYSGRISIEGSLPDPETDLPRALGVLQELAATAHAG